MMKPQINTMYATVFSAILVFSAFLCTPTVVQGGDLTAHPIFDKYASLDDFRKQVVAFKKEHPDEYLDALADFDLAIRSNLKLKVPEVPSWPRPHVIRQYEIELPRDRATYERWISELSKQPDATERSVFYKEHIDELSLEFTPALRHVALDVLLNGWNDWTGWENDRLREYRERYPDIHRIVALSVIEHFIIYEGYAEADGVLLRILLDRSMPIDTRLRIAKFGTRGDTDLLSFLVECAQQEAEHAIADKCFSCIQPVSETLPNAQRQAFWMPYLESVDWKTRLTAVVEIGRSRLRSREESLARHPDQRIVARLQTIANSDPDEKVRAAARNGVKAYTDDSPPRGLIDYSKPQK